MIHSVIGTFTLKNKGEYFEKGQKEIARCWFSDDRKGMETISREYQEIYGPISLEWNNPEWVTITILKTHNRYPWSKEEVL